MRVRSSRIVALTAAAGMLVGITLLGASAWGQPEKGQPENRQPEGRRGPDGGSPGGGGQRQAPSAEAGMKAMNGAMRRLHDQIGDASKKDDNLRLIGDMQRGAVTAKNAKPNKLKDIADEKERAQKGEEFRRDLLKLTRQLLDIEQNILDGKNDAAKAQLEEILKVRDAAHKKFGVRDDE